MTWQEAEAEVFARPCITIGLHALEVLQQPVALLRHRGGGPAVVIDAPRPRLRHNHLGAGPRTPTGPPLSHQLTISSAHQLNLSLVVFTCNHSSTQIVPLEVAQMKPKTTTLVILPQVDREKEKGKGGGIVRLVKGHALACWNQAGRMYLLSSTARCTSPNKSRLMPSSISSAAISAWQQSPSIHAICCE